MLWSVVTALVAGVLVWRAGTSLSRDADALAGSSPLSRAFIGVVLLGVATSLPEIATTVSAGLLGNPQLATGNLMGGVALQVVVLAVGDAFSRRPLTAQVAAPGLLVQHVAVLLLLALAIAGMAVGEPGSFLGLGLWPVLLVALYAASLVVLEQGDRAVRWVAAEREGRGPAAPEPEQQPGAERPPAWRMAANALVILAAGYVLARAGDRLAQSDLLDATFVGAVLVALATSLPELSTVIGSVRAGAYDLAVSNIVGTNSLEVALLFLADVAYRQGPLLAAATPSDVFLAALAALLTGLYLGGLLLRSERGLGRLGWDSVAVVLVYLAGMAVLGTR